MYCPICGTKLPDDAQFCQSCGSSIAVKNDNGESVVNVKHEDIKTPLKKYEPAGAKAIFILGLLSCIFGNIAGIILSAIALSKAKNFMEETNGEIWGLAKAGRILAKVGLPVSIVTLVLTIVFLIIYYYMVYLLINYLGTHTDYSNILNDIGNLYYSINI